MSAYNTKNNSRIKSLAIYKRVPPTEDSVGVCSKECLVQCNIFELRKYF